MNILIIEDDNTIREGTADFLIEAGYEIFEAESAEEGMEIFEDEEINLLILDIMLPGMNGIEFLKILRKESSIPVIMLTALSDEQTQVKLFDEMADDYLTKPFSLVLLKKRIEAQIRRYYVTEEFWEYGNAKVNFKSHTAKFNNLDVNLTAKEFKLLEYLIQNKGITVSRSQILNTIWTIDEEPLERVIDVYIKNLRKKLGLDCIKTIKGIGYQLS